MWLLDANMDVHLVELLREAGIETRTAESLGWKAFRNGELVSAFVQGGFAALLTRDQLFADPASKALRTVSDFCIVIVTLSQMPSGRYLEAFKAAADADRYRERKDYSLARMSSRMRS